jgi:hypothetical protein
MLRAMSEMVRLKKCGQRRGRGMDGRRRKRTRRGNRMAEGVMFCWSSGDEREDGNQVMVSFS